MNLRSWNMMFAFAASTALMPTVRADVTLQQKTTIDVASVITAHGSSTTSVTNDKQRVDSETHCEGVMSLVCGNMQDGNIVRLDKDVTWTLQPKKKSYREEPFATPEELAAMRAKMQANLEKMRSCPVSQKEQPIDKSKCQMSPPKIEVHKTGDKATIAGHETQRTAATLTETCTDKDTGSVCDTIVAIDVWLTQDTLPGSASRRAFATAYAKKLGMDETADMIRPQLAKFLSAYQSQIKQLTDKSSEFKGETLKTSLRVVMGGPQCATAKDAKSGQASGTDDANPMANVAQAGKQLSNMMGGLFHKKKTDDSDAAAAAAPADSGAAKIPDPYAQYVQIANFSSETVAIDTDAIPADRFEVPVGWKKEEPKTAKGGNDDYTCPKT